jgi:hypothetical protein
MNHRLWAGSLLLTCGTIHCSSNSSSSASAEKYPAYAPNIGQIQNQGGTVLTSPKIVTITWASDPNAAAFEQFGDKLGASAWWTKVVGQFGVGAATSGAANHVSVAAELPATIEGTDLETWLTTQLTTASSGFPAPDGQTVYVVYISPSTQLTRDGADACLTSGTTHAQIQMPDNSWVPYVFVDGRCNTSLAPLDASTGAASHDIAEAVTNPLSFTSPAVTGFDTAHLAWGQVVPNNDNEIGDLCELFSDAFYKGPTDLPFEVQRMWSNTSAAGGHDPCPSLTSTDPYFNVTPLSMEMITVQIGGAATTVTTYGYEIPVGTTKTITAGYYSDQATGYWNVDAIEGTVVTPVTAGNHLSMTVKGASGLNGDLVEVAVTVNSLPTSGNAHIITLRSTAPGHTTHWVPILIGAY